MEKDELAIFLLPMPVSLPGGKVGVYDSFRTISYWFKAVRSENLSRTQRLRKGRPFCPFCTQHKLAPWPKTTYNIYIYVTDLCCTYLNCVVLLGMHALLVHHHVCLLESRYLLYS